MRARAATAAVVLIAGVAFVVLLPWDEQSRLSYDAFRYLAGAESILNEGLYLDLQGTPQRHWPPGVSLLYAAVARIAETEPLALVRAIDITSYGTLVLACAAIAWVAGMRVWIATAMLAAIAWNGFLLSMHNKLWSEPPTLALFALLLLCLIGALRTPGRAAPLLLAACALAAAAILLRYAMIVTVPLVASVALLARRWWIAALALLAPIPTALTLHLLSVTPGSRSLVTQTIPWPTNWHALVAVADQLFPVRVLGAAAAVLFVLLCVAAPVAIAARAQRDSARSAVIVASLWTVGYGVFLPSAQAFTTPPPEVSLRMLAPLLVAAIIATAAACEIGARKHRLLAVLFAIPLLLGAARGMRFVVMNMHSRSVTDCPDRAWYIAAIRTASPRGPVTSNAQGVVWFALRRPVAPISASSAPARATVIWIDPNVACANIVEQEDVAPPPLATSTNGLTIVPLLQ
jgi:hypothetical protein